jgi:hypothetical protein
MYFTDRQEAAALMPVKKYIKEPVKKKADRVPAVNRDNEQNIGQLSGSNIFEPNRGEGGGPKDGNPAPSGIRVESIYSLMGVCDIDKETGAIIISRNQPPGPEPGGKNKVKTRHFYKTGDTLDGGYVLAAITQNSVTLKKGNDEQMLTISQKKNNAAGVGNIAAPGMPGPPPVSLPPRQRGGRP